MPLHNKIHHHHHHHRYGSYRLALLWLCVILSCHRCTVVSAFQQVRWCRRTAATAATVTAPRSQRVIGTSRGTGHADNIVDAHRHHRSPRVNNVWQRRAASHAADNDDDDDGGGDDDKTPNPPPPPSPEQQRQREDSVLLDEQRGSVGSALRVVYRRYLRSIDRRPVLTKSLSAAVVNLLGDVLAQYVEYRASAVAVPPPSSFVVDWGRVQTFFGCGLVFIGPFVHALYERLWNLGRWMERRFHSSTRTQTLAQVATDQTAGSLVFFTLYFAVFEIIDAVVHGRVPLWSTAKRKITRNLVPVLLTNWKIWPLLNWINFTFVPVELRVLINNVLGVLWNAYLCTQVAGA